MPDLAVSVATLNILEVRGPPFVDPDDEATVKVRLGVRGGSSGGTSLPSLPLFDGRRWTSGVSVSSENSKNKNLCSQVCKVRNQDVFLLKDNIPVAYLAEYGEIWHRC